MFQTGQDLWPRGETPAQAYCDEDKRLAVLAAHGTSALADDPELDRIVSLAAHICAAPMAMVTMVENERQVFLARLGLDASETPRPTSFCAHAMLGTEAMVVDDATRDPRFQDNPLVTGEPNIRFYAGQPLISREGAPLGALCVIDTVPRPLGLTELQRETLSVLADAVMRRLGHQRTRIAARHEVNRREDQLKRMIDSVPGIAFSADARGNFDYFNAQWQEMTGREPPRVAQGWSAFVHSDDFAAAFERWSAAVAATAPYEDRWRLILADGSARWVMSRVVPVVEEGGAARWFGVLTDIDAVHRETLAKDLIAGELSHRIKNIFAVISGLVAIRARGKPEVADYAAELGDAIRALGTAHDYVRPAAGRESDDLKGLLRDLLAPYDNGRSDQVSVTGAEVAIGSQAATPLALIFHELATNSAKYGALAHTHGTVAIAIDTPAGDPATTVVRWHENVPGVDLSGGDGDEGFGSRLLRMAIEGQLGGHFSRTFDADGLVVTVTVPTERISGTAEA